jgi:hypothetical protein
MKIFHCWTAILAWSAISVAIQGPGIQAQDRGAVVELGGLKSRMPAGWVEEKPDDAKCYRQYRLEPIDDDKEYAQVTICVQGKGKGDTAAEYVKRWKEMFFPAEPAKVRRLTANGAATTYLDVRGDYKGIPGDDSTPRQNFRLLGVYLDTPNGPCIIRLLGPAETVKFYRDGFEEWVKAFK